MKNDILRSREEEERMRAVIESYGRNHSGDIIQKFQEVSEFKNQLWRDKKILLRFLHQQYQRAPFQHLELDSLIELSEENRNASTEQLTLIGKFIHEFKQEKHMFKEDTFDLFEIANFIHERKMKKSEFELISQYITKMKKYYNQTRGHDKNSYVEPKEPMQNIILSASFEKLCKRAESGHRVIIEFLESIENVLEQHSIVEVTPRVAKIMHQNIVGDFILKFFESLDQALVEKLGKLELLSNLLNSDEAGTLSPEAIVNLIIKIFDGVKNLQDELREALRQQNEKEAPKRLMPFPKPQFAVHNGIEIQKDDDIDQFIDFLNEKKPNAGNKEVGFGEGLTDKKKLDDSFELMLGEKKKAPLGFKEDDKIMILGQQNLADSVDLGEKLSGFGSSQQQQRPKGANIQGMVDFADSPSGIPTFKDRNILKEQPKEVPREFSNFRREAQMDLQSTKQQQPQEELLKDIKKDFGSLNENQMLGGNIGQLSAAGDNPKLRQLQSLQQQFQQLQMELNQRQQGQLQTSNQLAGNQTLQQQSGFQPQQPLQYQQPQQQQPNFQNQQQQLGTFSQNQFKDPTTQNQQRFGAFSQNQFQEPTTQIQQRFGGFGQNQFQNPNLQNLQQQLGTQSQEQKLSLLQQQQKLAETQKAPSFRQQPTLSQANLIDQSLPPLPTNLQQQKSLLGQPQPSSFQQAFGNQQQLPPQAQQQAFSQFQQQQMPSLQQQKSLLGQPQPSSFQQAFGNQQQFPPQQQQQSQFSPFDLNSRFDQQFPAQTKLPEMAELLKNPQIVEALSNPEFLEMFRNYQQQLQQQQQKQQNVVPIKQQENLLLPSLKSNQPKVEDQLLPSLMGLTEKNKNASSKDLLSKDKEKNFMDTFMSVKSTNVGAKEETQVPPLKDLGAIDQFKQDMLLKTSNSANRMSSTAKSAATSHINKVLEMKDPELLAKSTLKEKIDETVYLPEAVGLGKSKPTLGRFANYETLLPSSYYTYLAKQNVEMDDNKWYLRAHHIETLTGNTFIAM